MDCLVEWTNNKTKLGIVFIVLLSLTLIIGCVCSLYKANKMGYEPVRELTAAEFEIPSYLLAKATAVNVISETEDYDGMYVYKNGVDEYVLFDTSSIVVACGETNFNFKGNETEAALESDCVQGVWMYGIDGEFNPSTSDKNGNYKVLDEVTAEYAITPNQYCNLTGYMATISNADIEYTVFAGGVGESLTKNQKEQLSHIVKSFCLTGKLPQKDISKDASDSVTKTEDIPDESIEKVISDDISETIKETVSETKTTTAYTPMGLKEWGYTTFMLPSGELKPGVVKVDNIYTGKEARALIRQLKGRKAVSSTGTSFVVAEYTCSESLEDAYLDIRFTGMDGERLKLKGISYTTRTYDLDTEEESAAYSVPTYCKRYVYYEVPTGCKEYELVFGFHSGEISDIINAHIKID